MCPQHYWKRTKQGKQSGVVVWAGVRICVMLHSSNASALIMPKVRTSSTTSKHNYYVSGVSEKGSGIEHVVYRSRFKCLAGRETVDSRGCGSLCEGTKVTGYI